MSHPANKYILPFVLISVAAMFAGLNWQSGFQFSPLDWIKRLAVEWKQNEDLVVENPNKPGFYMKVPKGTDADALKPSETTHYYLYSLDETEHPIFIDDLGEYKNEPFGTSPHVSVDNGALYYQDVHFKLLKRTGLDLSNVESIGIGHDDKTVGFLSARSFPSLPTQMFVVEQVYPSSRLNQVLKMQINPKQPDTPERIVLATLTPEIYSSIRIHSYLENTQELVVYSAGGDGGCGSASIWKIKADGSQIRRILKEQDCIGQAHKRLIALDGNLIYTNLL